MSFNTIAQWFALNSDLLLTATWQTLYMVAIAGAVGFALGIPLGVILHTTKKRGLTGKPTAEPCARRRG